MMNNTLIFKPKSKKLSQERSTTDYIVLWCYPSDDRRLNQLYIHQDDFLFLAVAYGIAIDHSGLDIYECYALKKQDWLKLLNEARKLIRFNSFKDMYDYLQQVKQEIAYDYTYSLTNYPDAVWNDRKEIDSMLDDIFAWTEFIMQDGDEIEILGL